MIFQKVFVNMSPKIGRLVPPDVVVVIVEGPELPQHLHHVFLGIYEDNVEKKRKQEEWRKGRRGERRKMEEGNRGGEREGSEEGKVRGGRGRERGRKGEEEGMERKGRRGEREEKEEGKVRGGEGRERGRKGEGQGMERKGRREEREGNEVEKERGLGKDGGKGGERKEKRGMKIVKKGTDTYRNRVWCKLYKNKNINITVLYIS